MALRRMILLIHGSAADKTTWSIQLASKLPFDLVAYDRRMAPTIADHAADAAALIREPAIVVGSSFGAVVALELCRTRPELVAGAVMIEPPLGAAPTAFLADYDRRGAEQGGSAAAEFFLRSVLGDAAVERMPRAFRDRAIAKHAEIRADCAALLAYDPRYAELARVTAPVLLLGGARSAPYFRATLDALAAVLPNARLEILGGAGHMLHAEAFRRFHQLLVEFAAELASA